MVIPSKEIVKQLLKGGEEGGRKENEKKLSATRQVPMKQLSSYHKWWGGKRK